MVPSQPNVPDKKKRKIHQSFPSADPVLYIECKGGFLPEMRNVKINSDETNNLLREAAVLKKMFHRL